MRCQANPPSRPGPTSRRVMGAHRGTDQTRGLPGDGVLLRRRVSTPPIPPRHPPAPRLKRPDPTVRRHPCPGSSGVEQWIENPRVGGSIPPPGTINSLQDTSLCLVSPILLAYGAATLSGRPT